MARRQKYLLVGVASAWRRKSNEPRDVKRDAAARLQVATTAASSARARASASSWVAAATAVAAAAITRGRDCLAIRLSSVARRRRLLPLRFVRRQRRRPTGNGQNLSRSLHACSGQTVERASDARARTRARVCTTSAVDAPRSRARFVGLFASVRRRRRRWRLLENVDRRSARYIEACASLWLFVGARARAHLRRCIFV